MNNVPGSQIATLSQRTLKVEVFVVYVVQVVLIIALVKLDRFFSLGGNLHTLVGIVFLLLPMVVLDRSDRPYERYGVKWSKVHVDLAWTLFLAALLFPIIALCSPTVWGMEPREWSLTWPEGYPGIALSHLLVVALPEEFFYRSYVMGRIDDILPQRIKLLGTPVGWSLLIQAILFSVGHYLVDFHWSRLAVFFPALVFGWLRAKRQTIVAPVFFHALSNIFMEVFRAGYGL
jgi:membrane protease YdiL (CAAX protease family)